MKIPYPGDLNPIDTAVWAAEFVRVRASLTRMGGPSRIDDVATAIEEANHAVDDLHHARERS
jgi:hypothetical protein